MAIVMAKRFLRQMAQPFPNDETGISLWTLEDIEARQAQQQAALQAGVVDSNMPMDVDGAIPNGHVEEIFEDDEIDDAALAAMDM